MASLAHRYEIFPMIWPGICLCTKNIYTIIIYTSLRIGLSWVEFIFLSLNIFLGRKKREQNPFRSLPTSDAHKYSTHTVFSYVMSQAQIDGCHSFCRMFSHFVFHCRHELTAKSFCSCNAMAIIVIHKKIADVTEQKCACKLVN